MDSTAAQSASGAEDGGARSCEGRDDGPKAATGPSPEDAADEAQWRLEMIDEFHSYVKPKWKPKLSAFCTGLTGIKQVSAHRHPGQPQRESYARPGRTRRSCSHILLMRYLIRTQSDVDSAPTFPELMSLFRSTFIAKHGLFTRENKTVWVTDGPWGESRADLVLIHFSTHTDCYSPCRPARLRRQGVLHQQS